MPAPLDTASWAGSRARIGSRPNQVLYRRIEHARRDKTNRRELLARQRLAKHEGACHRRSHRDAWHE